MTIKIDEDDATTEFGPEGDFDKPVIFNLTYMGLDLSKIDPEEIDFVYIDDSGNITPIDYQGLQIEAQSGKLEVINAYLPHFSRYGFVK